MAVTVEKVRVHHNPRKPKVGSRGKAAARGKSQQRQNPALVELGFLNPRGGRNKSMAKAKPKAKSNPHRSAARGTDKPKGKKNPQSKRRNPSFLSGGMRTVKQGVYALIGLVITRQIPQMLLKEKNTGLIGYGANLAAAWGASALLRRFAGPDAGDAALIGGGLYLANRAIQDHLSPVGKVLSLSGLGDAMALGDLHTDDRGYYPTPVVYDRSGRPIIPSQIRAQPAALAAPAGGMGMARGSRFNSRFSRAA